jgi:NAD(P) transhydrogenase subunit alpha
MPSHTSQLYGTNLVNLMKLLTPGKDGQLVLDLDDVVVRSITVTRNGQTLWPPPPVQVQAAPKPDATTQAQASQLPTSAELAERPGVDSSAATPCTGWPRWRSGPR